MVTTAQLKLELTKKIDKAILKGKPMSKSKELMS